MSNGWYGNSVGGLSWWKIVSSWKRWKRFNYYSYFVCFSFFSSLFFFFFFFFACFRTSCKQRSNNSCWKEFPEKRRGESINGKKIVIWGWMKTLFFAILSFMFSFCFPFQALNFLKSSPNGYSSFIPSFWITVKKVKKKMFKEIYFFLK